MNIDKAIRKQKKSYKIFMLSMCFIFCVMPTALILARKFNIFYIIYLIVLEVLIFLAIIIRINNEFLKFSYDGYKLKLKMGIRRAKLSIICDKVVLVHVENYISKYRDNPNFRIIILSTSKFRNDRMILVHKEFLKRHSYVAHQYNKMKILHPENTFYYTIIKRGELNKYPLLDTIYKSCVYAHFTEETIERIKYYRENSENYIDNKKK